ncbi:DNA polymerase III subunit beta family protein [Kitasatospora sp. NPDC004240]
MENDLRSIGELARDSGLGVSALRFYDGAGVLAPAWVDPQTGYRWYGPRQLADARLLCRLRRVGLPLAGIREVLGAAPGSGTAQRVIDTHLRRLEDGLTDARREISFIRALIDQRENPMGTTPNELRLTVPARELAAALDAVRFAVSDDAERPVLAGVLFDLDREGEGGAAVLRLVATDRYRMALAELPVGAGTADSGTAGAGAGGGAPFGGAVVPTPLVDGIRALLGAGAEEAAVTLAGGLVRVETGGHRIEGATVDQDYPDYRALVRLEPLHRVGLPAADLRRAVESGATRTLPSGPHGAEAEITVLSVTPEGALLVAAEDVPADTLQVAVNRDFLLEAVQAGPDAGTGATGQLVLELGGPIAPLAIRSADRAGSFSILMPVRLPA